MKPIRLGVIGCGNVLSAYRMCIDKLWMVDAVEVTMSRRMRNGGIGERCLARSRYGSAGPWWSELFYKPGGGCLFDLGVYCVNSVTGLLGPAKRVTAMAGISIPEREINGKKVRVEA